ncbi:MAG: acyltransferase [Solirubrobacteraceae bacterium]
MSDFAAHQGSAAVADQPYPTVAPPPGNPRFALFDALRGIAVLCIIAYHVTSLTGLFNRPVIGDLFAVLGNQALIFFFVISGFLLYRPYVNAHRRGRPVPSARRYARRRFLRIVPAYWVALTILAIYPGISGVFSGDWWRYYFFLQGYSNRTLLHGIPPAWSLTVEVSFYLLLPLWALLVRRLSGLLGRGSWLRAELTLLAFPALLGLSIQVAASRLLISSLLATTLLGECVWLALGMALAVASVRGEERPHPGAVRRLVIDHPAVCWLGAIACLIGATAVLHPGGLFNIIISLHEVQPLARTLGGIVLTAGMATFLVAPAVFGENAGGVPRRILAWSPLKLLGLISYGVYLYHLTIAELLAEHAAPGQFTATGLNLDAHVTHLTSLVLFVATLAVTAAAAALSYRFIELPLNRRKEPRGRRTAPPPAEVTGSTG